MFGQLFAHMATGGGRTAQMSGPYQPPPPQHTCRQVGSGSSSGSISNPLMIVIIVASPPWPQQDRIYPFPLGTIGRHVTQKVSFGRVSFVVTFQWSPGSLQKVTLEPFSIQFVGWAVISHKGWSKKERPTRTGLNDHRLLAHKLLHWPAGVLSKRLLAWRCPYSRSFPVSCRNQGWWVGHLQGGLLAPKPRSSDMDRHRTSQKTACSGRHCSNHYWLFFLYWL